MQGGTVLRDAEKVVKEIRMRERFQGSVAKDY